MTKEEIQKKIGSIIDVLNAGGTIDNADIKWLATYTARLDVYARHVLEHMWRLCDAEFHPRIRLECVLRDELPPKNLRKERKGDKLGYSEDK